MTFESTYPTLKLFIEKANKLENSGFIASITKEFRLGFHIKAGEPMEVTSIRPSNELIEAFVLTFRFFIQNNEKISIRNLQTIFNSSLVKEDEKQKYYLLRTDLNNFLSESANIVYKKDKLTNKDIMETIVYGELSHANSKKRQRFELWMNSSELFVESIWHIFSEVIRYILDVIQSISSIFKSVIKRHLQSESLMGSINLKRRYIGLTYIKNYGLVQLFYALKLGGENPK